MVRLARRRLAIPTRTSSMGHRASTRDACRTKGLLLLVEQFPREFSKLDSPPSPGERERSAFSFDAARAFAFRTVSQINVNYRGSPLSQGKAGHLYGGGRDRMPRVVWSTASKTTCQAHVYGAARPELATCIVRGSEGAPGRRNTLRPVWRGMRFICCGQMLYVGLADESGSVDVPRSYLGKGPTMSN
jgi:hypothetical protein